MRLSFNVRALLASALAIAASPADATDVTFTGNVLNSCTLTLSTPGTLALSSDYGQLSSEAAGGAPATLVVLSTGTFPTVTFGAPALSSAPAGWTDNATKEIRYTALLATPQAYTSSQTSRTLTASTDTFTLHGRVTSSNGFAVGTYVLRTVATCSL